jgi:hypothetical protein
MSVIGFGKNKRFDAPLNRKSRPKNTIAVSFVGLPGFLVVWK